MLYGAGSRARCVPDRWSRDGESWSIPAKQPARPHVANVHLASRAWLRLPKLMVSAQCGDLLLPSWMMQPESADGLNILHTLARESSYGYVNTAADDRSTCSDLELILKVEIDVHQDAEHDVLVVGCLRG